MKLVLFEEPIFSTIQGEGILVGMPSVFVRTYGCDFASCAWCDTKGSWQEGTHWQDRPIPVIIDQIESSQLRHVVVTGGNPLLQAKDLAKLLAQISTDHHITVETQASIYDEEVFKHVHLASLSPKLHDWRGDTLAQIIEKVFSLAWKHDRCVQVKVVCGNKEQVNEAIDKFQSLHRWMWSNFRLSREFLYFILQPEYSTGRKGVDTVRLGLEERIKEDPQVGALGIRLIPQLHKLALFVK